MGPGPVGGVFTGKPKLDVKLPLPTGLGDRRDVCVGAASTPSAGNLEAAKSTTVCLLNAERSSRALGPLRQDPVLERPALTHARDMVQRSYFAHDSPSGRKFEERIRLAGYLSGAQRWAVGENLAWGAGTKAVLSSIVRSWMESPPHRANILKGRYDQIGVGIVLGVPKAGADGPGATFATEFGQRTP